MKNIISFQEAVQSRKFDNTNFWINYKRLPIDKQMKIARMAIGFFHSQSCEYTIPDEVVKVILDNMAVEYKEILLNSINEQIINAKANERRK